MYSPINYWISREQFLPGDRVEIFLARDDRTLISSHCACVYGNDWNCTSHSCVISSNCHSVIPQGAIKVARHGLGTHDPQELTMAIQHYITFNHGTTVEDLHIFLLEKFGDLEK